MNSEKELKIEADVKKLQSYAEKVEKCGEKVAKQLESVGTNKAKENAARTRQHKDEMKDELRTLVDELKNSKRRWGVDPKTVRELNSTMDKICMLLYEGIWDNPEEDFPKMELICHDKNHFEMTLPKLRAWKSQEKFRYGTHTFYELATKIMSEYETNGGVFGFVEDPIIVFVHEDPEPETCYDADNIDAKSITDCFVGKLYPDDAINLLAVAHLHKNGPWQLTRIHIIDRKRLLNLDEIGI